MNNISRSNSKTEQLGEEFGEALEPGDTVLLFGDLGAGKTTFTKGIAKGLGIDRRIISPTFILQRTHALPNKQGNLVHIDLYRLDAGAIKNLGLEEIMNKDNIVVIEWAEKLDKLPKPRWEVHLKHTGEDLRSIEIKKI